MDESVAEVYLSEWQQKQWATRTVSTAEDGQEVAKPPEGLPSHLKLVRMTEMRESLWLKHEQLALMIVEGVD